MKKTKLGVTVTFFVVFVMLATVTVSPAINKDAVELTTENEIEPLNGDFSKLLMLKILGLDSLYGSQTIIEECWNAKNNNEFLTVYEQEKFNTIDEISKYLDGSNNILLQRAINIENAFSLEKLIERINTLTIENLKEDILILSNPPTKSTFNNDYKEYARYLMHILYNMDMDENEFISSCGDITDKLCASIRIMARPYTQFLYLTLHSYGLRIANHITFIFFNPYLNRISLIEGYIEALGNNYIIDALKIMLDEQGYDVLMDGGVNYLLSFMGGDYGNSIFNGVSSNVLNKVMPCKKEGVIFLTREIKPSVVYFDYPTYAKHLEKILFVIHGQDDDFCEKHAVICRDGVRMGIDRNEDNEVDRWTFFAYYEDSDKRDFIWYERVYENRSNYFGFVLQDQWGIRSSWRHANIHVSKEKSVDTINFPILNSLFGMFPNLKYLLTKNLVT